MKACFAEVTVPNQVCSFPQSRCEYCIGITPEVQNSDNRHLCFAYAIIHGVIANIHDSYTF